MELKDILTLTIAIYGAGLSTFNLCKSIFEGRQRVRVDCSVRYTESHERSLAGYGTTKTKTYWAVVEVINLGTRPISVRDVAFEVPNGRFIDGYEWSRQQELTQGQSISCRMWLSQLFEELKKYGYSGKVELKPTCVNTSGKRYLGKKWICDMAQETSHVD